MSRAGGRSGGRSGGRALDVTLVLSVVLPLLVGLAMFLTNPGFGTPYFHPPTTPRLTAATLVCPVPLGGGDQVGIASARSGTVSAGGQSVSVAQGGVGAVRAGSGPVVLTASGATAPGLVATRSSTSPLAATGCVAPREDQWFTGVGAGPAHDSFVELVNPNDGPAIADITVFGDAGPVDVPALRGIAIAGHGSEELDLGTVMPSQGTFALHATVQLGQVAIAVRDRAARLVGNSHNDDWLPAQTRPGRHALLLGLAPGSGSRQLTVANASDQEVTATVKFVTANSVFAPDNAPTLDIGPQSVARADLGQLLDSQVAAGVLGIQVVATGPVTATLRSAIKGDISITGRSQRTAGPTSIVVPTGTKQLIVGGANHVGALTVVARDAAGKQLSSRRVAITPLQALSVTIPRGAVRIDVTPERTKFRGSVVVTAGNGATILPLQRPRLTGRVPYVKPGLPR